MCGDYKVTVNKESIYDNYPIPRTEDIFATLSGGERFTKLDLRNAYQLLLDEKSRRVLTVNTHSRLFEPLMLQFEVHSATGIFQREIEKRLSHFHLPRCASTDFGHLWYPKSLILDTYLLVWYDNTFKSC